MSDWERGARRPCVRHIEALCEVFEQSAEDLGLISWRKQPASLPNPDATPEPPDDDEATAEAEPTAVIPESVQPVVTHEQVLEWVRDSMTAVAVEAVQALHHHFTESRAAEDRPLDDRD